MPDNNSAFIPGGLLSFVTNSNRKTPRGFGGLERTVDDRDFELGSYQPPTTIPATFMPDLSALQVYDQDKYPTCGAHAGATLDSKLQSDRYSVPKILSPKYLWAQIKQLDGYPLEDGTDMRSILKALSIKGDCDLTLLGNSLGTSLQNYSSLSNVTAAMVANGAQYLIKNYAFINNPTFEMMKQAIYKNRAAIILLDIGDGWWLPDWGHVLPLKLGNKVGRHFVTIWGYEPNRIWFRNSWGPTWGIGGNGFFEPNYVPLVREMGTNIVLPNQFTFTKDLQYGDSNNDVTQLQRRLGVVPDSGWFGPVTKAAVIKYQQLNGITPAVGYVGPLTRTRLNMTV